MVNIDKSVISFTMGRCAIFRAMQLMCGSISLCQILAIFDAESDGGVCMAPLCTGICSPGDEVGIEGNKNEVFFATLISFDGCEVNTNCK